VLGIVGFFVVPVVGLLLGFVLGVYLAELARLGRNRSGHDASTPHSVRGGRPAPDHIGEVEWEPVAHEQSPLTPVFDAATRRRTAEIIARYPQSRSALLPLLHLVQSVEGYVSQDGIRYCAEVLELTTAEVSAVATFYTMYKRTPCGEHLVSVCTAGEPGTPGSITLEHAECLAACDLAPVLQVNYEYYDNQTVESAEQLVDALQRGERPLPTRGAPLTDLRTVELELAGVFPDLPTSVQGNSLARETLRGAEMATARGWGAPAMPDEPPALPDLPEKK
jgi:NADH-quinone oxidoreductase subunit E